MTKVTTLLNAIQKKDPKASEDLYEIVYDELRRLAAVRIAHESPGNSMTPTDLVHEVYLKLVPDSKEQPKEYSNRRHFYSVAATAMQHIIIDRARARKRQKRGGNGLRMTLEVLDLASPPPNEDVLSLNEALKKLAAKYPDSAEIVRLKFFGGMSIEEAAVACNVSRAEAYRQWQFARAWLVCEMGKNEE